MCCVRTIQQSSASLDYLSHPYQPVSSSILNHFWWELYHSTMTPEQSINHHFTFHVAQASQAKHGSLVDRGANGGLAGSDVRILSRSSRKCTVTGIDSHELQGLDVVQCAALVETNHGIVNLSMNEYACYGDRIPSTTPGAEPPRDARDSGSARSHSTHLETSSSNRP